MKFEEGKILDKTQWSVDGNKVDATFRFVSEKDIDSILDLVPKLISEAVYLPNLKLENTPEWFTENFERCKRGENVFVVLEIDGDYAGHSLIERGTGETFHTGEIGIVLAKEYRGVGLGEELMTLAMKSGDEIDGLELLWLDYFGVNRVAEKLYKKLGFKNAGKLPIMYKRGEERFDKVIMFKEL
jgi:RimJ/RimL family protein N-acetyltransferase